MSYEKNTSLKNSKQKRIDIAQDTMKIVQEGSYFNSQGQVVSLSASNLGAIRNATYFNEDAVLDIAEGEINTSGCETKIIIINQTTMEAAQAMLDHASRVLVLNFASAKHPGGGFLRGAQAQEECLARSSNLYHTLTTPATKPFYSDNILRKSSLYTHGMILSPGVSFFKDDSGALLEEPYVVDVLTVPAVNAGAVMLNEADKVGLIIPTMEKRIDGILSLAANQDYKHLILGAWGCGVFSNDPEIIATAFKKKLEGDFSGCFEEVVFAILDYSDDKIFIGPFEEVFIN